MSNLIANYIVLKGSEEAIVDFQEALRPGVFCNCWQGYTMPCTWFCIRSALEILLPGEWQRQEAYLNHYCRADEDPYDAGNHQYHLYTHNLGICRLVGLLSSHFPDLLIRYGYTDLSSVCCPEDEHLYEVVFQRGRVKSVTSSVVAAHRTGQAESEVDGVELQTTPLPYEMALAVIERRTDLADMWCHAQTQGQL